MNNVVLIRVCPLYRFTKPLGATITVVLDVLIEYDREREVRWALHCPVVCD